MSATCCILRRADAHRSPWTRIRPKPFIELPVIACGDRAVRVDILERLADLIRPALSWREGSPGPKPDGFFDARSFVITGAMTSLTGASGEDFASILRSLGYRMDRKPKPVEVAPSAAPAATPDASPSAAANGTDQRCRGRVTEAAATGAPDTEPVAETVLVNDASSQTLLPQPELAAAEAAPPLVQEPVPLATEEPAAPAEAAGIAPPQMACPPRISLRRKPLSSRCGGPPAGSSDGRIGRAASTGRSKRRSRDRSPALRRPRRRKGQRHPRRRRAHSRHAAPVARAASAANVRIAKNDTSVTSASSAWNARMTAPSGRSAVRAANSHAATAASAWIGPTASSTMPSHSAAVLQTSSRIPIRRLQSLLHSSSSWSRAPKTRLEHREQGAGTPTYRQMACMRAWCDENRRRCADGGRFCQVERQAHNGGQPSRPHWRRRHSRARSDREGCAGGGLLRKAAARLLLARFTAI